MTRAKKRRRLAAVLTAATMVLMGTGTLGAYAEDAAETAPDEAVVAAEESNEEEVVAEEAAPAEEAAEEAAPAEEAAEEAAPAEDAVAEETSQESQEQPQVSEEPSAEEAAPADEQVAAGTDVPAPEGSAVEDNPVMDAKARFAPAVDVGGIQARMRDHLGETYGQTGNCIRYSPAATGSSSGWVGPGQEAATAHGYQGITCPRTLDKSQQSAIGFTPRDVSDIPVGDVTSIGTITHYNNPISTEDQYYNGVLDITLPGVDGSPVFSFPWYMNETPNQPRDVDDFTRITVQAPETVLYISDGQGGTLPYRMVVAGFSDNCSSGRYKNEWWTPERRTTSSQLCAQLTQVRTLEVIKQVEVPNGFNGTVPAFRFDSSTDMVNLEGVPSFWRDDFSLTPGDGAPATTGKQTVLVPNQDVTVTELAPDGWELVSSSCTGRGASAAGATISFTGEEVQKKADLPATCTFTNRPKVKPLTIDKTVSEVTYTQGWSWDIQKDVAPGDTMTNPAVSGTEFTYTVTVTPTMAEKADGRYKTNLTITNPNAFPINGVGLVDENCTVDEPNFDLRANETRTMVLSCTADEVENGTNTATITWTDPYNQTGSASSSADYNFDEGTVIDDGFPEVDITDTFPEFAEQNPVTKVIGKDGVKTFTYKVTHTAPEGECKEFVNTATITQTEQSDTAEAKVCNQADLDTSKNVITSLDRTYSWDIDKDVDRSRITVNPDGDTTAEYTVKVTEGPATDSNWSMTGRITVTNPNKYKDAVVTVTDTTDIGGVCTVVGGENATIPAGETVTFDYSCLFTERPSSYAGMNTATVEWADQAEPSIYSVAFTADDWNLNEKVRTTVVSDTFPELAAKYPEAQRTLTWSEEGTEHVFTYVHTFTADELPAMGECTTVDNTASLSTGGSDTVEVELCKGALTLTKVADRTSGLQVGDVVTYTFTATNAGKIPLTNVTIEDTEFDGAGSLSALTCTPEQPATLAPGESMVCTATYTILEADLGSEAINNVATADSNETPPVTDDERVTTVQLGLTVTKVVTDPRYVQDYDWSLTKTVNPDGTIDNPAVSGTEFGYTVTVTPSEGLKHSPTYTTVLTITNPNTFTINDVQVFDDNCTIGDDDSGFWLGAKETRTVTLTCSSPSIDMPGTNQASITWHKPGSDAPGEASSNVVDLDFSDAVGIPGKYRMVDVTDTFPQFAENYGEVRIDARDGEQVYTYSIVHTAPPGECAVYDNVAKVTGLDDVELDRDTTQAKVCNEVPLKVAKTVDGSYDLTHLWKVHKSVYPEKTEVSGDKATLWYDVAVTYHGYDTSSHELSGTITIDNPNVWARNYSVEDVFRGVTCDVDDATGTIPAGGSVTLTYTCALDDDFMPGDDDTNVATVWSTNFLGLVDEVKADAMVDWDVTEWQNPVTVTDTFHGEEAEILGTITVGLDGDLRLDPAEAGEVDGNTVSFGYARTVTVDQGECTHVKNVASVWGDDKVIVEDDATSEVCAEADLVVTKTAEAHATVEYLWKIDKKAVKEDLGVVKPGSTVTAEYVVTVTPDGYKFHEAGLKGAITVTNPNAYKAVDVHITDVVSDDAWECTHDGGPVTIGAGETKVLHYTCSLREGHDVIDHEGTNTVHVTWTNADGDDQTVEYVVGYKVDVTEVNKTVTVKDKFGDDGEVTLGTVEWVKDKATEFTYSRDIVVGAKAGKHELHNTAWIVESKQSDDAKVWFEVKKPKPKPKPGLPKTGAGSTPGVATVTVLLATRREDDIE